MELCSKLAIKMYKHFVIHLRFSQKIQYWNEFDGSTKRKTPSVETFLKPCVDQRREIELLDKLEEGRVFVILDGYDEITGLQEDALKMIRDLLLKKVNLLVTSRPQEISTLKSNLALASPDAKVESFELDVFLEREKLLILQTRLEKSDEEFLDILKTFDKAIKGFSDNPLHLQMICDVYESGKMQLANLYEMYNEFLVKKSKHGLSAYRQIDEKSAEFQKSLRNLEEVLMKKAVCSILQQADYDTSCIENGDRIAINCSGVATVLPENNQIDYVHRSYAEFLIAKMFLQIIFPTKTQNQMSLAFTNYMRQLQVFKSVRRQNPDFQNSLALDILVKASIQTKLFIELRMPDVCGLKMKNSFRKLLMKRRKLVFDVICREGLIETFKVVIEKYFKPRHIAKWLRKSQTKAFNTKDDTSGLFVLACRHNALASKFDQHCSNIRVGDLHQVMKFIAEKNKSLQGFEIFLSKIKNWQKSWPNDSHITDFISLEDFSIEQIDYLTKNCSQLGQLLVGHVNSTDFSKFQCRYDIIPLLLKHGLDLTIEKNGIRMDKVIAGGQGLFYLLQHLIEAVEHFIQTTDIESEKSLVYRKNFGALFPSALGSDCSSQEKSRIIECISQLADDNVQCQGGYRRLFKLNVAELKIDTQSHQNYTHIYPIVLSFLYCSSTLDVDVLKVFLEIDRNIPRNFKFKCGCSLVHAAVANENISLLKLLIEKGFGLFEVDKEGQTPLHLHCVVCDCFQLVLQNILGDLFVPLKGGDDLPRSDLVQAEVEEKLGVRDFTGRKSINVIAKYTDGYKNLELLVKNLLGHLYIIKNDTNPPKRSKEQQDVVIRNLLVKDNHGSTPLHGDLDNHFEAEVLLRNLLGEFFISVDGVIRMERSLEKQKEIASMMLVKDFNGFTPIHKAVEMAQYRLLELLLLNLLGDYYVNRDGSTRKPIDQRSEEENGFVHNIVLDKNCSGISRWNSQTLLLELNFKSLLPFPRVFKKALPPPQIKIIDGKYVVLKNKN